MRDYFGSWLVRLGTGLFVIGVGPLLVIIGLAKIGLLGDPNPNPVGAGMLAAFTFWPAIACLGAGIIQVSIRKIRLLRIRDRRDRLNV